MVLTRFLGLLLLVATAGLLEVPDTYAADNAKSIYSEAVEAHWKWNLDEAIRLYTRVIALDPNHARAYFNRGVAYRSKGEEDRALADFSSAISKAPDIQDALYGRGLIYLHKERFKKTVDDMNRVLELEPKHSGALRVRAEARLALGDSDVSNKGPRRGSQALPPSTANRFSLEV